MNDYKKLISEKQFLRVQERAYKLGGVNLVAIYYKDNELVFKTLSGTDHRTLWTQRVIISDLEVNKVAQLSYEELCKLIMKSNLKVYCNCIAENTDILTKNGNKRIQDITEEDEVFSTDKKYHKVAGLLTSDDSKVWYRIYMDGNSQPLIISEEHKVLVHAFQSKRPFGFKFMYKKVKDVTISDCLCSPDGDVARYFYRKILKIERDRKHHTSYDISLYDEPHNYVANGVFISNCPAFKFWGYQYMAWKRGYGIVKESRAPIVRNPNEEGHLCFRGGTQVLTKEGYVSIESIKVGDYVYSHRGVLQKVLHTFVNHTNEIVHIRVDYKDIYCTPNHSFLTYKYEGHSNSSSARFKGGELQWVMAKNLKRGYEFVKPLLINKEEVEVDSKLAFFLGLYLSSDGHISGKYTKHSVFKATVNGSSPYILCIALNKKYARQYRDIFDSYNVSYRVVEHSKTNRGCIFIEDADIKKFCLENGGYTYANKDSKFLTSNILKWGFEAKKALVRGFFLGGGTIVEGAGVRGKRTTYVTLFNTNKDIMNKLYLIISEYFDVRFNWYDRKPFKSIIGREHTVYPKRMYYIRVSGKQLKTFLSEWLCGVEKLKDEYKEHFNITDYLPIWQEVNFESPNTYKVTAKPIRMVETISTDEDVYNIEVENDNSYIVETVSTHNCKHLYQAMAAYPFLVKFIAKKFKSNIKSAPVVTDSVRTASEDDLQDIKDNIVSKLAEATSTGVYSIPVGNNFTLSYVNGDITLRQNWRLPITLLKNIRMEDINPDNEELVNKIWEFYYKDNNK